MSVGEVGEMSSAVQSLPAFVLAHDGQAPYFVEGAAPAALPEHIVRLSDRHLPSYGQLFSQNPQAIHALRESWPRGFQDRMYDVVHNIREYERDTLKEAETTRRPESTTKHRTTKPDTRPQDSYESNEEFWQDQNLGNYLKNGNRPIKRKVNHTSPGNRNSAGYTGSSPGTNNGGYGYQGSRRDGNQGSYRGGYLGSNQGGYQGGNQGGYQGNDYGRYNNGGYGRGYGGSYGESYGGSYGESYDESSGDHYIDYANGYGNGYGYNVGVYDQMETYAYRRQLRGTRLPETNVAKRSLTNLSRVLAASATVCGLQNYGLIGKHAGTLYNVADEYACQLQCQLHSDVTEISNCTLTESGPLSTSVCVASSYSTVDGRCTLLADVVAAVPLQDVISLPVACAEGKFAVDSVKEKAVRAAADVWSCLNETGVGVYSGAAALMTFDTMSEDAFSVEPTSSQRLRADVEQVLKAYPALPALAADDNGLGSLEVREDRIYQVANVLHRPHLTTSSGIPFAFPRGVDDWRECALLCDVARADCEAWTYLSLKDQEDGGCFLASSQSYPITINANSGVHVMSGPALSDFPSYLFGATHTSSSTPTEVANTTLTNGCHYVNYKGFLFQTKTDSTVTPLASNLYSLAANNLTACATACSNSIGCVAYQFIPADLKYASTLLNQIGDQSCIMFSSLGAAPILHASDPLVGSGFISCGDDDNMEAMEASQPISQLIAASPQAISATMLHTTIRYESGPTYQCSSSAPWSKGWSFVGTLIPDQPNMIKNLASATDCDDYCRNVQGCEGWTYGATWGACYIYAAIDGSKVDSETISGRLKCNRSLGEVAATGLTLPNVTTSEFRTLDECDRRHADAFYEEGSILGSHAKLDNANDCFRLCRVTMGCNYMSYIPKGVSINSATSDPTKTSACVLLADVADPSVTHPLAGAYSSEMLCDAFGTVMSKESAGAEKSDIKTRGSQPIWIVVGSSTGLTLVIGGLVTLFRKHRSPDADLESSSSDEDDSYIERDISDFTLESPVRPVQMQAMVRFQEPLSQSPEDEISAALSTQFRAPTEPGTCITMRTESEYSPQTVGIVEKEELLSFQPASNRTQKDAH